MSLSHAVATPAERPEVRFARGMVAATFRDDERALRWLRVGEGGAKVRSVGLLFRPNHSILIFFELDGRPVAARAWTRDASEMSVVGEELILKRRSRGRVKFDVVEIIHVEDCAADLGVRSAKLHSSARSVH